MSNTKVTVKISFGDDLRRLSVDSKTFTFAQLVETVRRLYTTIPQADVNLLAVKYIDDEEDLVTITSDEELQEAFNVSRNKEPPVLRLYLKDATPQQPQEQAKNGCNTESGEGCAGRRGWGWGHHGRQGGHPWWARRHQGRGGWGQGRGCPFVQQQQQQQQQAPVDPSLPKTLKDPRHEHELTLTPQPYGHGQFVCDGCQLSGVGASYHCERCQFDLHPSCDAAREVANPWHRRQQWFRLHQEGMKALEATPKQLDKARASFKEQAEISPYHRMTPLYNLACVEALANNADAALKYLQEAIAAGYNDVEHLQRDTDLDSLRNNDGFKALLASLQADSTDESDEVEVEINVKNTSSNSAPNDIPLTPLVVINPNAAVQPPAAVPTLIPTPAPELKPVPPPTTPAPQFTTDHNKVATEFDEKLKTLEDMGWGDRRRNITALVLNRGDLQLAVQYLLDGSMANRQ